MKGRNKKKLKEAVTSSCGKTVEKAILLLVSKLLFSFQSSSPTARYSDDVYLQEQTPLFLAASEGHVEAVEILLSVGANKEITDYKERSPKDIALERNLYEVVERLSAPSITADRRFSAQETAHFKKSFKKSKVARYFHSLFDATKYRWRKSERILGKSRIDDSRNSK